MQWTSYPAYYLAEPHMCMSFLNYQFSKLFLYWCIFAVLWYMIIFSSVHVIWQQLIYCLCDIYQGPVRWPSSFLPLQHVQSLLFWWRCFTEYIPWVPEAVQWCGWYSCGDRSSIRWSCDGDSIHPAMYYWGFQDHASRYCCPFVIVLIMTPVALTTQSVNCNCNLVSFATTIRHVVFTCFCNFVCTL